ncbi:crossover junction endodeoxyribonuclease RuvC [Candidatus Parcubacteria bacterium]|nr:MAG: crossover junction endodeoxyribonuclease RuvC [Candidatus Parcubacteria bacterium]
MTIVGIDPGSHRIGYAVINGDRHKPALVRAETIEFAPGLAAFKRLPLVAAALAERFERDQPVGIAVERLFFAKNVNTALPVAETRGIILLTAARAVSSIWEYTPLEVKLAVTGSGNAAKADVKKMLALTFGAHALPRGDDAIDAIAIALTALARGASPHGDAAGPKPHPASFPS